MYKENCKIRIMNIFYKHQNKCMPIEEKGYMGNLPSLRYINATCKKVNNANCKIIKILIGSTVH